MDAHENKLTVERFDRLAAACDADALDELCTPDMANHALASHRSAGLEGPNSSCANAANALGKPRGCTR